MEEGERSRWKGGCVETESKGIASPVLGFSQALSSLVRGAACNTVPQPSWLPDASGSLLERGLQRPVLQGDAGTAPRCSAGLQRSAAMGQHCARNSCWIPVSFFVWHSWSQHTSFWFRSHADLGTQKINTDLPSYFPY